MGTVDFIPLTEPPAGLAAKGAEQFAKSLYVWEARYGSKPEVTSHITLGHFGFVPLHYLTKTGYFWLEPTEEGKQAPPSVLAAAKRAFFLFSSSFSWNTFIFTEVNFRQGHRFARFMGFEHTQDFEGQSYYVRGKDVD